MFTINYLETAPFLLELDFVSGNSKNVISDHVWIECYVNVFKGTIIAKGCVVAAKAVLRDVFEDAKCLIPGGRAKVVKKKKLAQKKLHH
jgi:acetyltransferase-like isoleucine patch superfamily enzyme